MAPGQGISFQATPPNEDGLPNLGGFGLFEMIGTSRTFTDALRRIGKIARFMAPALIEGETGCGKEMAARAVHYLGARRDGPFIPVNCGAIPDALVESEFFGHARGAFTDAKVARQGVIGQAKGGTLFLDEVDALSPRAQVGLLRFLQDQRYRPVGHDAEITADVRIISAANRPLAQLVAQGHFRSDLLFRLNVLYVRIPSLRDREADAELLADHFLGVFSAKYGVAKKRLHRDAVTWIRSYPWPGNVRELENLIHREFLLEDGPLLRLDALCLDAAAPQSAPAEGLESLATSKADFQTAKALAIAEFERRYVASALRATRGNVSAAAKLARKERRAFGKLLKKHGIDRIAFR